MKKMNLPFLLLLASLSFGAIGTIASSESLPLFAEEEVVVDPAFDRDNFLNPANYIANVTPVVDEKGLLVEGASSYNLPFAFDRGYSHKIKFKFDIEELGNYESATILLSNDPSIAFLDQNMTAPGVYFSITKTSESTYRLDGYYTDGINYTGQALTLNKVIHDSVIRDHTLQIETSLVAGYTDGIRLFYNGEQFADWLCYSMVKNNAITDSQGRIYISTYGKMRITNITPGDDFGPRIDYEEPEEKAYAGDDYEFGEITVTDEIDGKLPWTFVLFDPAGKNISNKASFNEHGRLHFKPLSIGEYTLRVLSNDYSTNAAAKRILLNVFRHEHYPVFDEDYVFPINGRSSSEYIIPKVSAHDIDDGGDNEISYTYGVYYYSDSGVRRDVTLSQKESGEYYFIPKKESAYRNDGMGKYYITVSANNSYGESVLEREIYVKPDIVDEASMLPENYLDEDRWTLNDYNTFGESDITLIGNTSYKAGLKLDKGIFLYFSVEQLLDKTGLDNWFSFGFTTHPGEGKYGAGTQGLYFMFFYQNGAFRYNMQYVTNEGVAIDIKNNEPLASDFSGETSLAVYPFDESLDPTMYDNIDVALNGGKVDSFEIYKIARSEMTDDEGFVYLNFGYSNAGEHTSLDPFGTNNPIVHLHRLRIADKKAPVLTLLGDVPTSGKAGERITFPGVKAVDETDGEVEAYLSSIVGPDGVAITVINNVAVFPKAGEYIVSYKAVDYSGNIGSIEKTILISKKGGCKGAIIPASSVGLIALIGAILLAWNRRKERED